MKVQSLLAFLLVSAASTAGAQVDPAAPNANLYNDATRSQARDARERLGLNSGTRDVLPAGERQRAEEYMRDFAQCVVRGDGATARQLLATPAGSNEEHAIMSRVAQARNGCLGKGKLKMNPVMMRGAVAEQLYLRNYASAPVADANPKAQLTASTAASSQPYHAYAQCVVARDAPAADAVLRAKPASPAEADALEKTMPTLSSCLGGGEQARFRVDRTALRGLLAEALYDMRAERPQG